MLTELLGSKLRAKLLGWLFTHPDEHFFVRQLESLLGEDSTNLSRELTRLAGMGIVKSQTEGRQKYYQVDPASPFYTELRNLALKTFGLTDILRDLLEPLGEKIEVGFVYGSQVSGEVTAGSDVDVMVIGEVTFAEVVAALGLAQERLGREVNPAVYPKEEFRTKLAEGHHFLKTIMSQPKIFLIGDERELKRLG